MSDSKISLFDSDEGTIYEDSESGLGTNSLSYILERDVYQEPDFAAEEIHSASSFEQASLTTLLKESSVARQMSNQQENVKNAWENFASFNDTNFQLLKNSLSNFPRLEDLSEEPTLETENSLEGNEESELQDNSSIEEDSEDANAEVLPAESDIVLTTDSEFYMQDVPTKYETEKTVAQELLKDFINQTNIRKTVYYEPVKVQIEISNTKTIVADILDDVVLVTTDYCIANEPFRKFREKFDKPKLMREIEKLLAHIKKEKHIGRFLNLKSAEYYRRKKHLSMIMTYENPDFNKIKLDEKYHIINVLKSRDEENKKAFSTCITELSALVSEMQAVIAQESQRFDNLVKGLCAQSKCKHVMETRIHNELEKMTEMRKKISNERVRLIFLQKKYSKLRERVQVSQFISHKDNITYKDFEKLQTECMNLQSKLKERCDDIDKFHQRFNKMTNIFSMTRCYKISAEVEIAFQYKKYVSVKEINMRLNNDLQVAQKNFLDCQKKIRALNPVGGLANNKNLLLDYDRIEVCIEEKRVIVEELRRKYKKILKHIEHLQATRRTSTG